MSSIGNTCEPTQSLITNYISDRAHFMTYIIFSNTLDNSIMSHFHSFEMQNSQSLELDNIEIQIFELEKYFFIAMRP